MYKSNRRHKDLEIFKSLSDEIRQVRLDDVRGGDGNLAPHKWFNASTREYIVWYFGNGT